MTLAHCLLAPMLALTSWMDKQADAGFELTTNTRCDNRVINRGTTSLSCTGQPEIIPGLLSLIRCSQPASSGHAFSLSGNTWSEHVTSHNKPARFYRLKRADVSCLVAFRCRESILEMLKKADMFLTACLEADGSIPEAKLTCHLNGKGFDDALGQRGVCLCAIVSWLSSHTAGQAVRGFSAN